MTEPTYTLTLAQHKFLLDVAGMNDDTDVLQMLRSLTPNSREPVGFVDESDDGLFADFETPNGVIVKRGDKLFTHPAPSTKPADGWQPIETAPNERTAMVFSDDDLTKIYNKANGIQSGKSPPITTEKIFTAMREMLASAPQGDSK